MSSMWASGSSQKTANLICGECEKVMDYWDLTDPENPVILEDYNDGLYQDEDSWFVKEGLI